MRFGPDEKDAVQETFNDEQYFMKENLSIQSDAYIANLGDHIVEGDIPLFAQCEGMVAAIQEFSEARLVALYDSF